MTAPRLRLSVAGGAFHAVALTTCNACDAEPMHDGCEAGYCAGCCPVH